MYQDNGRLGQNQIFGNVNNLMDERASLWEKDEVSDLHS
jgi:hypothetical protein